MMTRTELKKRNPKWQSYGRRLPGHFPRPTQKFGAGHKAELRLGFTHYLSAWGGLPHKYEAPGKAGVAQRYRERLSGSLLWPYLRPERLPL